MTHDEMITLFICLFFVLFVVAIVVLTKKFTPTKEENDAYIEEYFQNDGEIIEEYAEVINLACGTKMVGTKSARTVECYVATFRNELGKIREIAVDHEMYDALEVGMHGTLKLVDGRLYSFEAK